MSDPTSKTPPPQDPEVRSSYDMTGCDDRPDRVSFDNGVGGISIHDVLTFYSTHWLERRGIVRLDGILFGRGIVEILWKHPKSWRQQFQHRLGIDAFWHYDEALASARSKMDDTVEDLMRRVHQAQSIRNSIEIEGPFERELPLDTLAVERFNTRRVEFKNRKRSDWADVREALFLAAGGRCRLCNAAGPLHAHHRTYERVGAEQPGDLTALCRTCHGSFHVCRKTLRDIT
jgi:hypothetical protein